MGILEVKTNNRRQGDTFEKFMLTMKKGKRNRKDRKNFFSIIKAKMKYAIYINQTAIERKMTNQNIGLIQEVTFE